MAKSEHPSHIKNYRRWAGSLAGSLRRKKVRFVVASPPSASRQKVYDKSSKKWMSVLIRNEADLGILRQIFLKGEYDLAKIGRGAEIFERYHAILANGKKPLILDCGANIGVTSLYLRQIFPEAEIIAVEPSPENFALAQQNLAQADVTQVQAGVASSPARGEMTDPGMGEHAFRVQHTAEGSVRLLTISQILEQNASADAVPFFCKIDIEGAEKQLFEANTDWVETFFIVAVEFHDRLFPGQAYSRPALRVMSNLGWDFEHHSESAFFIANAPH